MLQNWKMCVSCICSRTPYQPNPQLARIFLHSSHLLLHAHVQVNPNLWQSSLYLLIHLRIPFLFGHCKHFRTTCNCFWQFIICCRCTAVGFTPVFISHLWNLWTKYEFKNCQWCTLSKLLRHTEFLQSKDIPQLNKYICTGTTLLQHSYLLGYFCHWSVHKTQHRYISIYMWHPAVVTTKARECHG